MKIFIAGGSGLIGRALIPRLLLKGHDVSVLTRAPSKVFLNDRRLSIVQWDGETIGGWTKAMREADVVVNLSGENLAGGRWTEKRKKLLLKSRIQTTRLLVGAMKEQPRGQATLINISAVGFYGNVPTGVVDEQSPNGNDFLSTVCARWEEAALEASAFGVRVVTPRLGVVLANGGGALGKLVLPFKFFAGGYIGSGDQWFSWIHRSDLVESIIFLIDKPAISGAVNLSAPHAVTMKEFSRVLGEVLKRPSWTAASAFLVRLALGEMSDMLLTGQNVVPRRLLDAGFAFKFPDPRSALMDLLGPEQYHTA